jgi:hypothetical protein
MFVFDIGLDGEDFGLLGYLLLCGTLKVNQCYGGTCCLHLKAEG